MVHVQIANNHYKEINGNSGTEACVQPPSSLPFSRFFLKGRGRLYTDYGNVDNDHGHP